MRRKIAVVTAFSERCVPFAEQLIASIACCARRVPKLDVTVWAYECNWMGSSIPAPDGLMTSTFSAKVDLRSQLGPLNVDITQRSIHGIQFRQTILPDITVYHHFALESMQNYDYVLFCHDDVCLNPRGNLLAEMIDIVDGGKYNIIAEVHATPMRAISLRFYPHFIFVRRDVFLEAGLSFVNDLDMFGDQFRKWDVREDGGAQLLASYYHRKNRLEGYPFKPLATWQRHIRLGTDMGVETFDLYNPGSPQFHEAVSQAKRNVELLLDGSLFSR